MEEKGIGVELELWQQEKPRVLVDPLDSKFGLRSNYSKPVPPQGDETGSKKSSMKGEGPTRIGDISRSRVLSDASRITNSGGLSGPGPFACAHLR
jgi:hypothetical protein